MTLNLIIAIVAVLAAVAVTGWIFYALAKRLIDGWQKQHLLQMKIDERQETLRVVTPIRLQAYERMALFLERISPDSLVMRCYQPGMDLRLLQGVMTKNIRDEWEHNLSQQVYISAESWALIRQAKEEMLGMVNAAGATLEPDADPTTLAARLFANWARKGSAIDLALEHLTAELRELYA